MTDDSSCIYARVLERDDMPNTEKYMEKRDETIFFITIARNILAEINSLFEKGLKRLDFGMDQWKNVDKRPSFDLTKPPPYSYDEKNLYVNASNNLWIIHVWRGLRIHPSISELYYVALLNRIKEFKEKNSGFDFNKGIVYANLGVAQSGQKKLDEGFANILKALIEDSNYSASDPQYDLHRRRLFTQFEEAYVSKPLQEIILQLGISKISSVEQFVENFLESLNNDQRTFFDYTFARIVQSQEIWHEKNNGFTANRLLAYTQDFCLFTEDLLKSKISLNTLSNRQYWVLRHLIPLKFPGINLNGCQANTMADLDNLLPSELSSQSQPDKYLRILLTLRNYSSHNVEGGTSQNCFYARYEDILKELVRAMCEIALLPKQP